MSDTDMTAVADAIRAKTGGSDPLSFPTGFSDAIASISGSGGGGGETEPDKWKVMVMNRWIEQSISIDDWEIIGEATGYHMPKPACLSGVNLTRVELPGSDFLADSSHPWVYIPERFMESAPPKADKYTEVVPAEGVAYSLGQYAFAYAKLKTMPFKIAGIGNYTFKECTFENGEFTLPSPLPGLTAALRSSSFSGIKSLGDIKITVPAEYSLNDSDIFSPNKAWSLVMLATTPPTLHNYALGYSPKVATITVPKGSLEAYQSATNWAKFADIMVEAEE